MNLPIQKILIPRPEIAKRILTLSEEINQSYRGEKLILIAILKGSVMFVSDLMKELDVDVEIGFLYLSSYQGATSPQSDVKKYLLPLPDIRDRHVLLIDDILDTGASLDYARSLCLSQEPRSLKTCVFLVKQGVHREKTISVDFRGFDIPNEFAVGYGLDYQERYRQLPFIAVPSFTESTHS